MKACIDRDEWYPVYTIEFTEWRKEVDIPQDLYDRYKKAANEFSEIQEELAALYGGEV